MPEEPIFPTDHYSPEDDPIEILGKDNAVRRLFEVEFTCPICPGSHGAELYISAKASNLDALYATARQVIDTDDTKVGSLMPFVKDYHEEAGDYKDRVLSTLQAREEGRDGRLSMQITRIVLTAESDYTCDECGHTFKSIALWRDHYGQDRRSGNTLPGHSGLAKCLETQSED